VVEVRLGGEDKLTGEILPGQEIRQPFKAKGPQLESIAICFATFKRINTCLIRVQVYALSGKCLFSTVRTAGSFRDNDYEEFQCASVLEPGKVYEIKISALGLAKKTNAVTAKWGGDVTYPVSFAGRQLQGTLACRLRFLDETEFAERRRGNKGINRPKGIAKSGLILKVLEQEAFAVEDGAFTEPLQSLHSFLGMKRCKLAVIVLTKDHPELIGRCMTSFFSHCKYDPVEYVIGDTGSTDPQTLVLYERWDQLPHVKIIRGLQYHFAKNYNELVKYTDAEFVLISNNDVFVHDDSISRMMNYAMIYVVGSVGLRLLNPIGWLDHDGQFLYSGSTRRVITPGHLNYRSIPSQVPCDNGLVQGNTAAFVLLRRSVFEQVDGFCEDYKDIYQDCDLALEVSALGLKHVIVRDSFATHVGGASRKDLDTTGCAKRDANLWHERWIAGAPPVVKPTFSMITCCSKPRVYFQMLNTLGPTVHDKSLVELLPIYNLGNRMTVVQALNRAADVASGRYLIFCHQDLFLSPTWLLELDDLFRRPPVQNWGVVGFEGVKPDTTPAKHKGLEPDEWQEAQTLDELCLITRAASKLRFDEQQRFHFYGPDICMEAASRGMKNYIVSPNVVHRSSGATNILRDPAAFKNEAEVFWRKWKDRMPAVVTTTTWFKQGGIKYLILPKVLNCQVEK